MRLLDSSIKSTDRMSRVQIDGRFHRTSPLLRDTHEATLSYITTPHGTPQLVRLHLRSYIMISYYCLFTPILILLLSQGSLAHLARAQH